MSMKKLRQLFGVLIILTILLNVFLFVLREDSFESKALRSSERISWEDEELIRYEENREGPGEQGEPHYLTKKKDIKMNREWYKKEGFYVIVSDQIALDRSLPDVRPEICRNKTYLQQLPNVSVIVTFHNEIWSTLLRCLHSIYNRSKNVLHEIVLINDKSSFDEVYEPLRKYIKEQFDGKVLLLENEARIGLIQARMKGAKAATGEVIVFLDSHMEVTNNWLPPLLELLVLYPRIAAVPIIEVLDAKTFEYGFTGHGCRGGFDWNFRYQFLPLRSQDQQVIGEPFESICMTGGAYAIRRDNFFRLGGYDEGLRIWNGENYELTFKLWLCSGNKRGGILEVPCSRVAHLSKRFSAHRYEANESDFIAHNLKRVAEVWLDEYKEFFYRNEPERFKKLDVGDLTKQFELKEKLQCKSFKHYLEVVAPDMLERYPPNPVYFASGRIRPETNASVCLGMARRIFNEPLSLFECDESLPKPKLGTTFMLTHEKSIRYFGTNDQCFGADKLNLGNCDHNFDYQYWKFDLKTRHIENPPSSKCLTADLQKRTISLTACLANDANQKWHWSWENQTALDNWKSCGLKDP